MSCSGEEGRLYTINFEACHPSPGCTRDIRFAVPTSGFSALGGGEMVYFYREETRKSRPF